MAIHESLDPAERSGSASDTNGRWVPVGGRTGSDYPWTVTVDVGNVDSGSVTVRVEGAQRRSNDDVTTLATFPAFSTPASSGTVVTVSGYLGRGYLRTVANIDGTVTVGTTEEARFFDVTSESGRITRQVSNWSEIGEAASRAERELLDPYKFAGGRYALHMDRHGWTENIRDAIATQVERRFQLWSLSKSSDPSQVVTRRQMDTVDPEAKRKVKTYSALGPTYF